MRGSTTTTTTERDWETRRETRRERSGLDFVWEDDERLDDEPSVESCRCSSPT